MLFKKYSVSLARVGLLAGKLLVLGRAIAKYRADKPQQAR